MRRSKMFLPLLRGVTGPLALHPSDDGEVMVPVAEMVTVIDCTGAPVLTPEPVYVPASADSVAGWSYAVE